MAVAQRAMVSALRRNIEEAEKYYNMLRSSRNEDIQNIVLDTGIEAMPNIEHNLALMYLREGLIEESKAMTEYMEMNRSGSLVVMRSGRRSMPQLRPVSEATARLYRQIEEAVK